MGLLEWLKKAGVRPEARKPEAEPRLDAAPAPPSLSDDAIAAALTRAATEGFRTDQDLVEQVTEALVDEFREEAEVPARVLRLVPQVLNARQEVERSWPVPTDCDLLDRAFARLEDAGVVARQDFTCCQNCGHHEIQEEIEKAGALRPVRGYTFYHHQDTERAAEGGRLYLAFGAVMPDGTSKEEWLQAEARIADEVVAALRAQGLSPSWNGEVTSRIEVPLLWRRRRRRR